MSNVSVIIYEEGTDKEISRYTTTFRPFNVGETITLKVAAKNTKGEVIYNTDEEQQFLITKCEPRLVESVEYDFKNKITPSKRKVFVHVYVYFVIKS